MKITVPDIWTSLEAIRRTSPVIHNITNYVVMNSSANALLALGASPVMAHAEEEVEEMVSIAGALVINIGTLSPHWIRAMFLAAHKARSQNIPIVLDPVGAGATTYRTETARKLLSEFPPEIIRGNASEIVALIEHNAKTKGVDSLLASHDAVATAHLLSKTYGSVVCVSGATDYVIQGEEVIKVLNGHPMMTKVTGMGCIATALCAAFAAVNHQFAEATAHAMAIMGIAGEIAAERSPGPGSLQVHFFDTLYRLSKEEVTNYLKIEE